MSAEQTLFFTGITGTLGRAFLMHSEWPGRIRGLSRDEQKQEKLRQALGVLGDDTVQLVLGDVRDPEKLERAIMGCSVVIAAAALKVIPNAGYNPDEFVKTNIVGTMNVLHAAIKAGVEKVVVISTDKACEPTTLYGATKMIQEHLAQQANRWSDTKISCVRYGNVVGSRGSVTNILAGLAPDEVFQVTDPDSTRFWITQEAAVKLIDYVIDDMQGGEIYVPRIPAKRLGDMIPDGQPVEVTGLRWTEKRHETLIAEDELKRTDAKGDYFVVHPHPYQGSLVEQVPYRSDGRENWGTD